MNAPEEKTLVFIAFIELSSLKYCSGMKIPKAVHSIVSGTMCNVSFFWRCTTTKSSHVFPKKTKQPHITSSKNTSKTCKAHIVVN